MTSSDLSCVVYLLCKFSVGFKLNTFFPPVGYFWLHVFVSYGGGAKLGFICSSRCLCLLFLHKIQKSPWRTSSLEWIKALILVHAIFSVVFCFPCNSLLCILTHRSLDFRVCECRARTPGQCRSPGRCPKRCIVWRSRGILLAAGGLGVVLSGRVSPVPEVLWKVCSKNMRYRLLQNTRASNKLGAEARADG